MELPPAAPPQEKPPAERKGKWTLDEDARLMEGVKLYTEKKPTQIANFVGTRNSGQVRDRLKQLRKTEAREVVAMQAPAPAAAPHAPVSVAAPPAVPAADAAVAAAADAASATEEKSTEDDSA